MGVPPPRCWREALVGLVERVMFVQRERWPGLLSRLDPSVLTPRAKELAKIWVDYSTVSVNRDEHVLS